MSCSWLKPTGIKTTQFASSESGNGRPHVCAGVQDGPYSADGAAPGSAGLQDGSTAGTGEKTAG